MKDEKSYRTPSSARMVQVIEIQAARGKGTEGDPVRLVYQYWSKEGVLLAENDPETDDLGENRSYRVGDPPNSMKIVTKRQSGSNNHVNSCIFENFAINQQT